MAARRARREAANEEPAPAAPLLALPGPAFPHMSFDPADTDDTAAFAIHGRRLVLQPAGGAASLEGEAHTVQTAGSVWDCSVVLAKLLEMHLAPGPSASSLEPQLLPVADRPLTILELGAGTGLVGLAVGLALAARQDALGKSTVVLTDVAAVVPALAANIQLNGLDAAAAPRITAAPLDWLRRGIHVPALAPPPPYDLVLAADVVWVEELIVPFVQSLAAVCGPQTRAVFAYQSRSSRADKVLFAALEPLFSWTSVAAEQQHPVFRNPDKIQVFLLTRREGSGTAHEEL